MAIMKTRNLIILSCLSVFGFMGCETTEKIDDFPLRPSQLVVNCSFTEGIPFAFQVSKSLSVLDNADLKLVDSATVKLYKNDELIETITEQDGMGWYSSETSIPEAGQKYSIKVSSPDFEKTLLSEEIAPIKVLVTSASIQIRDSSFYEWEDRNGHIQTGGNVEGTMNIVFSDPADIENYYSLSVFYVDTVYDNYDTPEEFRLEKRMLGVTSDDSSIENDGNNFRVLLFRDLYFDGQDYKLALDFNDWQAQRGKKYYIELTTLQRTGYLYKKSIDDYSSAVNDPFAEPVQIYDNIENGYGIFAGYAVAVFIVSF